MRAAIIGLALMTAAVGCGRTSTDVTPHAVATTSPPVASTASPTPDARTRVLCAEARAQAEAAQEALRMPNASEPTKEAARGHLREASTQVELFCGGVPALPVPAPHGSGQAIPLPVTPAAGP
jgi:hypothetical protein